MNPAVAPRLSIVIPVLDEARTIVAALARLQAMRARGVEIIVVDGGSRDDTVALATRLADRVLSAPRGRGAQMHAGALAARGDALLFLHADTLLPANADQIVPTALADQRIAWGRFDVHIDGTHPLLRLVAPMMNLRSRLTGIATGDQAMFMTRATYDAAGGFADIALMEDIALSATLRRLARPVCLRARVTTSGRRWEARGVMRTIVLMWRLRVAYWRGADPNALARRYGYRPRADQASSTTSAPRS